MIYPNPVTSKKISSLTRHNIIDSLQLNDISWSGRMDEVVFLSRLYDLSQMPSGDSRYKDASGDIYQHRVNNPYDWPDDWVFIDPRFNLLHKPDEEFLKFLCETLHPAVRRGLDDTPRLLESYNQALEKDGFILTPSDHISGQPIYSYQQLSDARLQSISIIKKTFAPIDASYLHQQITRLESAIQTDDPELAIGTAKELVETICKTILKERGVVEVKRLELPQLIKEVTNSLKITPSHIPDDAKSADTIRKLLGNLSSIVHNMAELRNEYGTGHGKLTTAKGLTKRHAKLAAGAATTLATFLFESHQENPSEKGGS